MSTNAPVSTQRPASGSAVAPAAASAVANVDWEKPTNRKGLEAMGEIAKGQLLKALPKQLCNAETADRMVRCLITECGVNPSLLECTPLSLFACAIRSAQLGLEIGGVLGRSYLIPFKNNKNYGLKEAQLVIGYKGFVTLMHNSGAVKRITPVCVREGDRYEVIRGLHQNLIHVPLRGNTARVTDYYVVIELQNGGMDFEEFTVDQAIQFRNEYALARSGPWFEVGKDAAGKLTTKHEFDGMALKTLIRRIAKRSPMSADVARAVAYDDAAEHGTAIVMPKTITGEMPDVLTSAVVEEEKPRDEVKEIEGKLAEVNAGGGGDGTAIDFLSDAIKRLNDTGAAVEELCEFHKVKIGDIKKLTGAERGKWADIFNAEAEKIELQNKK